jgi:hypothetical protein
VKTNNEDTNENEVQLFECLASCGSIQKTFIHKEELELHTEFFHGHGQDAQSKSQ